MRKRNNFEKEKHEGVREERYTGRQDRSKRDFSAEKRRDDRRGESSERGQSDQNRPFRDRQRRSHFDDRDTERRSDNYKRREPFDGRRERHSDEKFSDKPRHSSHRNSFRNESKSEFDRKGDRRSKKEFTKDSPPRQTSRPEYTKRLPEKEQAKGPSGDGLIRLNRFIANAGICSRREADELIEAGQITVNGKVVAEMGFRVKPSDIVKYGKRVLNAEKLVYVLLNKPKGYITTTEDPEDRKTVLDLIEGACEERVYPVGRLDRNTTGLLLITNDGELADKLTHPSNNIRKIYQAELDRPITLEDFETLQNGVELEDGFIKPDDMSIVTPDAYVVGIEIHSGRNRIVRRLFEHLNYEVKKLDRTVFSGLNKKDLPRGKWRFLTQKEVITLRFLI